MPSMTALPVHLPQGAMIGEDGVWEQVLACAPSGPALRPALFLDRDGVIVEEVGHLRRPEQVRIIAGAAEVIATAAAHGAAVVIVSNQSGLGRGLFGWDDFIAVQARILGALAAAGARVDGVFVCPHHPEARPPYRHSDHPARKPNPGLLLRAASRLRLDLGRSWIVGDRVRDLAAGINAGLAGGMLVGTGYGRDAKEKRALRGLQGGHGFRVLSGVSIADALGLPLLGGAGADDRER